MYDIIIFDFDGTIYDTLEGICRCMQYALKKQGIEAELQELQCFAGPPLLEKIEEVYGFSGEKAEEIVKDFRYRYKPVGINESRLFPGIKELLQELSSAGKRLGIATSKPEEMAVKLLDRQDITKYFEVISGAHGEGRGGSKEEVLNAALGRFGAGRERCVLVGDTKYDVAGAHKCGLECIAVKYGYAAEGELEDAGADIIAGDIKDLQRILLS